jgi:hypothetical protein
VHDADGHRIQRRRNPAKPRSYSIIEEFGNNGREQAHALHPVSRKLRAVNCLLINVNKEQGKEMQGVNRNDGRK